jgi:hypothetical protein
VARNPSKPVVDRLEPAVKKVVASGEARQRMRGVRFVVPPGGVDQGARFVESEVGLWTHVVKTGDIEAE